MINALKARRHIAGVVCSLAATVSTTGSQHEQLPPVICQSEDANIVIWLFVSLRCLLSSRRVNKPKCANCLRSVSLRLKRGNTDCLQARFNDAAFQNSVPTSQETLHHRYHLMLFREIILLFIMRFVLNTYIHCEGKMYFLNVKADGTYSYQRS
jgi:hypothetical protein